MKKRNWLLLIIIIIGVGVRYNFFYKSYNNTVIAASADKVLAVDVKRSTNTIVEYFLTHPSTWDLSSVFSAKHAVDTAFDWKQVIHIPDYIFIFHSKGQPENVYYTVLSIKKETGFQQALVAGSFEKGKEEKGVIEYFSSKCGMGICKKDDQLLISNSVNDKSLLGAVGNELFNKKDFLPISTVDTIVAPANDFSIYLAKNNFLVNDVIANGNFTNGAVTVTASFQPASQYPFNENTFDIPSGSLLNLAFVQPSKSVYALIPDSVRSGISMAVSFNIDSFFLPQNKNYQIDLAGVKKRTDSAISYEYDDNFNKVEKVVTNVVEEPSFNCSILSTAPSMIFNYLKRNKNIEQDSIGSLFVADPFVKTYATIDSNYLFLKANNYDSTTSDKRINCIAYLNVNGDKLPATAINYLPDYVSKILQSIRSVNCVVKKDKDEIAVRLEITNKDTSKPFLLTFK